MILVGWKDEDHDDDGAEAIGPYWIVVTPVPDGIDQTGTDSGGTVYGGTVYKPVQVASPWVRRSAARALAEQIGAKFEEH